MQNLTNLGDKMFSILEKLENGEIEGEKAKEMVNVSNTIVSVSRVQLEAIKQYHKMNTQAAKQQPLPSIFGIQDHAAAEEKEPISISRIVKVAKSQKTAIDKLSPSCRKFYLMSPEEVKAISNVFDQKTAFSIKQGFKSTGDAISHFGASHKFEAEFRKFINS